MFEWDALSLAAGLQGNLWLGEGAKRRIGERMIRMAQFRLALMVVCACGLLLAQVAIRSAAVAQDGRAVAGTLTCEGKGALGLILGSKERLDCKFAATSGGPERLFAGTITRVGLDIGVRGKSVMIWTVLASTGQLPHENLVGNFAGVSADVALGLGAGANVLVGGNKKSVVLQPVSVKAGTGVNIAVGVSGLRLEARAR
jgi:hypothetical protein